MSFLHNPTAQDTEGFNFATNLPLSGIVTDINFDNSNMQSIAPSFVRHMQPSLPQIEDYQDATTKPQNSNVENPTSMPPPPPSNTAPPPPPQQTSTMPPPPPVSQPQTSTMPPPPPMNASTNSGMQPPPTMPVNNNPPPPPPTTGLPPPPPPPVAVPDADETVLSGRG